VCRRLSGSLEVAGVAIILAAYHAHLADLYYSTGTIVDILCFFFYFAALWLYMRTRQRSAAWIFAVFALYAGALAAKEIAATLPVLLLLYDLLYYPPGSRAGAVRWAAREAMRLALFVVPTVAVAYLKTAGSSRVTVNPDFMPTFSWQVFSGNWRHYAHDLFYGASDFHGWRIVALWVAVVALAAVLRRRDAWIAAAICLIGILPVAFIPERGFYAVYVTLPGWYLLAARTLTTGRERLLPRAGAWDAVGLLVVLALGLAAVHARQKPRGMAWVAAEHDSVRRTLEPLRRYVLPPKAEVLVTADPYDPNDSILLGIFRLRFRDPDITVRRVAARPGEHYDAVFTYASPAPGVPSALVRASDPETGTRQ